MDFKKLYMTDPAKAQGVWTEPDASGARYLIARYGHQARARAEKLQAPYKRQFDNGSASPELRHQLLAQCLAETVLLDWDGLQIDGKLVAYSREAARQLLEQHEDFADFILKQAVDKANFDYEQEQATVKN